MTEHIPQNRNKINEFGVVELNSSTQNENEFINANENKNIDDIENQNTNKIEENKEIHLEEEIKEAEQEKFNKVDDDSLAKTQDSQNEQKDDSLPQKIEESVNTENNVLIKVKEDIQPVAVAKGEDSDEDGGDWINITNISKKLYQAKKIDESVEKLGVAIMTTDYAMQVIEPFFFSYL